jgi:hypothetical protein
MGASSIDPAKLRYWWSWRQGLDGGLAGKPPEMVLERTGWARSVGGVGPYLTLYSRAGITRTAADAAAAKLQIHELPSARGCTYVLPAADFALGLRLGQSFGGGEMNLARKLGVTDAEIEKLEAAVTKALDKGPLDPDALKEATGSAVRNLGEEGKKKGLTTTLPLTLGRLQSTGEIRRIPTDGRFDQQRYRYTRWKPNPLAKFKLSPEECATELGRKYFSWIGPASLAEFQWFSGLGVKAAKAAVEPLKLQPFEAVGDRFLLAEHRDELAALKVPKEPQYSLVSSIDGIHLLRRDAKGLLEAADWKRKAFGEKGLIDLGGLADFPSHMILDRGRVVGLWEFDTSRESVAWMVFGKKDQAVEQAVKRTEEFVRTELGDARSFSLDSPKSRAPRVEALRKAGV